MSCNKKKIQIRHINVIYRDIVGQGWVPNFGYVEHQDGYVTQLTDWVGGAGDKPTDFIGWYVGVNGLIEDIDFAVIIGKKGDKGDPFVYSDFTPDQIEELQQPAVDAANMAVNAAGTAIDSSVLANQAAEEATTASEAATMAASEASDESENANIAAANANNSADIALSASETALESSTDANDAAQLALNAADTASNARGWAPLNNIETYGEKAIMKLIDYVSGTGTKPTNNIGEYYAENGFTADPEDAIDLRGLQGLSGYPTQQEWNDLLQRVENLEGE